MRSYFDKNEIRSPEERKRDLDIRLRDMAVRGYHASPRLKAIFDEKGLKPSDIASLEDLQKLPVISRQQVIRYQAEQLPYGGFAAEDVKADRIFISPGPVYEPHLKEYSLWSRGYFAAGFDSRDRVLNTFSYHMVAAGLTFHEGLRAVGATVIPSGTSNTEHQVRLINDLRVTAYTGTPSFLLAIINKAEETGYDFKRDFVIRKACFVAEPLQPSLRSVFENTYGIDTYQMYGATEVGDIAYECAAKAGWHAVEDSIIEIVDPSTGSCVEQGRLGEVVVTRLNDIFYLMRFGTGDLSSIEAARCTCGRTSFRLRGVAGRVGDAVKVRGMFITPGQIAEVARLCGNIEMRVIITRESYRDMAIIEVASSVDNQLKERLQETFQRICIVRADEVKSVMPGAITEAMPRIVDSRKWD